MEYNEKLWDTRQDGESDSKHTRGLWVRSCRRERDIWLVYYQVWGKTGVRDVGIPILTVLALSHEEDNSRQEKRDKVEFNNRAKGPWFRRWHRTTVI